MTYDCSNVRRCCVSGDQQSCENDTQLLTMLRRVQGDPNCFYDIGSDQSTFVSLAASCERSQCYWSCSWRCSISMSCQEGNYSYCHLSSCSRSPLLVVRLFAHLLHEFLANSMDFQPYCWKTWNWLQELVLRRFPMLRYASFPAHESM